MSEKTAKRDAKASKGGSASKAPEKQPLGAWTREQLEAIVVAVILALIIRHFAVEAFKIPTGSMQPTLYGSERGGDRILVFKPSFVNKKPSRWDILVFKYPLNTTVNYIKRCVGLPGETLSIEHGDVLIDGEIAQKPRDIQKHLWRNWPVYPRPGFEMPPEEFWKQQPEGCFTRSGRDLVAEGATECAMQYPTQITVGTTAGRFATPAILRVPRANAAVSDVLLEVQVRPETADTTIFAEIRESNQLFRLEIEAGKTARLLHRDVTGSRAGMPAEVLPFTELATAEGPVFEVGKRRKIEFCYLDGRVRLDVDGRPTIESEYRIEIEQRGRNHLRFGLAQGKAAFRGVKVFRDLYHTTSGDSSIGVEIPEGHYFMLGDNTLQSKDSRLWSRTEIETNSGRSVFFDIQEKRTIGNTIHFKDEFGQMYSVDGYRSENRTKLPKPSPLVKEEYILGKAFSTFWPLWRDGSLNLHFVH